MQAEIIFYILLLAVAFLYSSVGHGGASGYLALMALFSFAPSTMRITALILNILVSAIAFSQYYRSGHFRWNLFWPFAITSIPAAYFGGTITIDESLYKKILGILLLISVIRLIGFVQGESVKIKKQNILASLIIGIVIGLFSGMIGIGGGIILSPLILLLNWADMKQTAAVSALFIFVNSLAGIAGIISNNIIFNAEMGLMLFIAFAGGIAGAYLGSMKINSNRLKYMLSVVLVIAALKLIFV